MRACGAALAPQALHALICLLELQEDRPATPRCQHRSIVEGVLLFLYVCVEPDGDCVLIGFVHRRVRAWNLELLALASLCTARHSCVLDDGRRLLCPKRSAICIGNALVRVR